MTPEELNRIADEVLAGDDVPWDGLLAAATTPQDRQLIEQLRTLAAIARLHDAPPDSWLADHPAESADPTASEHSAPRRPPGEPIGQWAHLELLARLGSGSYGEVFRAWDPRLEREVALKLLHRPVGRAREDIKAVREARLLAKVQHPNVVTVYGAQVADGRIGLWTELIDGRTLDEIVRTDGPMSATEAVLIASPICRALYAIHAAGVLHRDVKAQNVLRARGGRIVVMDFGAGGERTVRGEGARVLAGSPVYLAPEVLQGRPATVRSDVYSAGVLVFYLLTGDFPVAGATVDDVRQAHARNEPTSLHALRSDVPQALVRVIERACAADPADRYADAAALERALVHALGFSDAAPLIRPAARPWRRLLIPGAALAAVLGAAVLALSQWARDVREPSFERLTFRQGKVHGARFGAEGGNIVYAASWGRERPRVYLTTSGARQSHGIGAEDATLLAFSSQGEMALALRPRFLRPYVEAGVLARSPLAGGSPRELLYAVQAADWSPDGAELAVVRDVGGLTRLEYPIGRVRYETSGWISSPRVAPDGSAIAFIDHAMRNDDRGRVAVIRGEGSLEALTGEWSSAQGLAWSADGNSILFAASESGNRRSIYAIDEGGRLRLVHRGAIKMRLHDVSRRGAALVSTSNERVELLARGPDDAEERTLSWLDWSVIRHLSADGQTLLMNESGEGGGERYAIYLRGLNGGDAVRLGEGSGMSLSPDGRWVLASMSGSEPSLVLLPTGAGAARGLPNAGLQYQQWGAWFPDGRRVVFAAREEGRATRLFVQATDGRSPPVPITPEGVSLRSPDAVAPDGSRIAAVDADGRIVLYGPRGRLLGEVAGSEPGEFPLQWTPHGRGLYVCRRSKASARIDLLDLVAGTRTPWREVSPADPTGAQEIVRIVISRSAETYAYSVSRELSDLFLMSPAQ